MPFRRSAAPEGKAWKLRKFVSRPPAAGEGPPALRGRARWDGMGRRRGFGVATLLRLVCDTAALREGER